MEISKALPLERYTKALTRSKSPEFLALHDKAIQEIREWLKDPRVNKKVKPACWCGGGKDSTAILLLLKLAGIDFVPQFIDNQGDLPMHYAYIPELMKWSGISDWKIYKTEKRLIDCRYDLKQWGLLNGVTKKDGTDVDFFDLGPLEATYDWYAYGRYAFSYSSADGVAYVLGMRAGESMQRAFEIKHEGRFQFIKREDPSPSTVCRLLPIGLWKDLDVWALLAKYNTPVSPVYSMHAVPQKQGRGAFPRTLYYCDPSVLSATYFKWLSVYCPGLLNELLEKFPEIEKRFSRPVAAS